MEEIVVTKKPRKTVKNNDISDQEKEIESRHNKTKELNNELKQLRQDIERKEREIRRWVSETDKLEKSIYKYYKKKAESKK
jgi:septal ring factor EnvC (AmiA/AmiB activator)